MDENARHLVAIVIPAESVVEFLCHDSPSGRWQHIRKGVPRDAKFCGMWHDLKTDTLYLKFEHESFPLVAPGAEIPRYLPCVHWLHGVNYDYSANQLVVRENFYPAGVRVVDAMFNQVYPVPEADAPHVREG